MHSLHRDSCIYWKIAKLYIFHSSLYFFLWMKKAYSLQLQKNTTQIRVECSKWEHSYYNGNCTKIHLKMTAAKTQNKEYDKSVIKMLYCYYWVAQTFSWAIWYRLAAWQVLSHTASILLILFSTIQRHVQHGPPNLQHLSLRKSFAMVSNINTKSKLIITVI